MRASRLLGSLLIAILANRGSAQTVLLQIKPYVGDTIRMRLDQQSELSGVKRTGSGEANALAVTTMKMFSRAIVEAATDRGTTVLAVTDSVILTTSDEHSRAAATKVERDMRGQRVRFRVSPDGSVGMNENGDGVSRDVAQMVSLIPAAFPRSAISVGESWIREMALPVSQLVGGQLSGKLYVTFRFDSLTHGGDWAFVSMRGELKPSAGAGLTPMATIEKGTVSGTMLVDQRRRWLTESWFTIVVSSVVTPPLAVGVMSMRVQTRITQHMHTQDRRR